MAAFEPSFNRVLHLPYLKYHLSTSHAFHHYLGVAGRCLAQHLRAYGGQVQQDCLQGMCIK